MNIILSMMLTREADKQLKQAEELLEESRRGAEGDSIGNLTNVAKLLGETIGLRRARELVDVAMSPSLN